MEKLKNELKDKLTTAEEQRRVLGNKIVEVDNFVKEQMKNSTSDSKDPKENVPQKEDADVPKPKSAKKKSKSSKARVTWIGTSLSKSLDKEKFERDTSTKLSVAKAYCIKEEVNAKYKETNFKSVVPRVLEETETDVLVLQGGSIEITDINVHDEMTNSNKDLEELKKEWFNKVEDNSKELFDIAEEASRKDPEMKVIIIKRLPRFDKPSDDILGIKSQLSTFSNLVYEQLLIKKGKPKNIHIVELEFGLWQKFKR